jgi:uncharacterized cupin superfamily protein
MRLIEPGAWSSQRHWHSHEDEFVWVLDGELTLVTDAGEERHCAPGSARPSEVVIPMAITWLINRIRRPDPRDRCIYPDIDMIADDRGYTHRDGTPYPLKQ